MQTVKAALAYFLFVLAAAFLLGAVRELWVVPAFGERSAQALEAPLFLLAVYFAAYWSIARFAVSPSTGHRIAMGLFALALAGAVEALLVIGMRNMTLAEYVAARDPVSSAIFLALLAVYAAMPLLILRQ